MVEQMTSVAEESSNGWNNAGTGHAALMELNHKAHVRHAVNKRFRLSQDAAGHLVGPKLTRNMEGRADDQRCRGELERLEQCGYRPCGADGA
jgi:hypothetical protein